MTTVDSKKVNDEDAKLVAEMKIRIKDDDNLVWIDEDSFTIDEIEQIEDIIDGPIDSMEQKRRAPSMKAMAYVTMKRNNPDFKFADAGKLKPRFVRNQVPPTKPADS